MAALEATLRRKRIPCTMKLSQIEAMQEALRGYTLPLSGAPLEEIDVDQIFLMEKQDRSYVPTDRAWFQARDWAAAA